MLTGEVAGMIMMSGGGDADFGAIEFNQNGTYTPQSVHADVDGWNQVTVNVPTLPTLQDKTITENGSYTADSGYDGLGTVTVNIDMEEAIREAVVQAVEDAEGVCQGTPKTVTTEDGEYTFPTGGITTTDVATAMEMQGIMAKSGAGDSATDTNSGWSIWEGFTDSTHYRYRINYRNVITGQTVNIMSIGSRDISIISREWSDDWVDYYGTHKGPGFKYLYTDYKHSDPQEVYCLFTNGSNRKAIWETFTSSDASYTVGSFPTYAPNS